MPLYNRAQIVQRALASTTNKPGTCQLWTRTIIGAPSVGDVDHDGQSDAEDGWKSEPVPSRHTDRNPPPGVPVRYKGGSNDNWHSAVSLGDGLIRSTDAGGSGKVATVPLDWPEKHWGLKYVGWSDTMDGQPIPLPPSPNAFARKAPRKQLAKWGFIVHLAPVGYMDYEAAVRKAARKNIGVDIDVHLSKDNTMWALHWGTVSANGFHDPEGKIRGNARIADLTDAEIGRLRSINGHGPRRVVWLLRLAASLDVRVELELKVFVRAAKLRRLLAKDFVKHLNDRGLLQFKALALFPHAARWLGAAKRAGGVTLLTFTGYKGQGVSRDHFWPVTDYVRGTPRWV